MYKDHPQNSITVRYEIDSHTYQTDLVLAEGIRL